MESLDALLAQVTPATRGLVRTELIPALLCFRNMIEGTALEPSLHGALEQIKGIYVRVTTQQAIDATQARNPEALATLIETSVLQRSNSIFHGFSRIVEVAYGGKPTSKSTALELLNVEVRYLLEGICLPKTT
ncbi:MAG TPA: hypothetical protein VJH37_04130 [Candidatus Nanoarchaeia archaeon]|nr:hypothetical protein [Candidatus Nanoarchaeia archaeon]